MEKKSLKVETDFQNELLDKASLLMEGGFEFVVRRNITDVASGEKKPGNLQRGWRIMNINRDNEMATLYNSMNEIFHAQLGVLQELNPDLFVMDQETLKGFASKKQIHGRK